MFEHIPFFTYQTPTPVTPELIAKQSLKKMPFPEMFHHDDEHDSVTIPANMKHADFFISGSLKSFSRPPISPYAAQNLYHMDSFSIFTCGSDFFTKRSDYDSFLILYTYEGNGLLTYDGKTYHLSSCDGFFIDCKKPHLYRTDGVLWEHSVFHLNGPLVQNLFDQLSAPGSVVFSDSVTGTYQSHLERLLTIYNTHSPYRDYLAADCISNILTYLLQAIYTGTNKSALVPENLQYLVQYMNQNFSSPMTLDFLANFAGISKYHLSREFKKYTGFSPHDYLILLRIEQAKNLLNTTSLPANKIAYMVGIHDLNNFTNLFKKKTGKTPGQFRSNHENHYSLPPTAPLL